MANSSPSPSVSPKTAALIGAIVAILTLATIYVPALKPVCQAFGGCADPIDVQLP